MCFTSGKKVLNNKHDRLEEEKGTVVSAREKKNARKSNLIVHCWIKRKSETVMRRQRESIALNITFKRKE